MPKFKISFPICSSFLMHCIFFSSFQSFFFLLVQKQKRNTRITPVIMRTHFLYKHWILLALHCTLQCSLALRWFWICMHGNNQRKNCCYNKTAHWKRYKSVREVAHLFSFFFSFHFSMSIVNNLPSSLQIVYLIGRYNR